MHDVRGPCLGALHMSSIKFGTYGFWFKDCIGMGGTLLDKMRQILSVQKADGTVGYMHVVCAVKDARSPAPQEACAL